MHVAAFGAPWLVVHGRDHAEQSLPVRISEYASPIGEHQPLQGAFCSMTGVTGLGALIHGLTNFGPVRGEEDRPLLAEHPHPGYPLLLPDGVHDVKGVLPSVLEHGVMGATRNGVAELTGPPDDEI